MDSQDSNDVRIGPACLGISAEVEDVVNAYRAIQKAKLVKCTCSGFSLQYDGCMCARTTDLRDAEGLLMSALESLADEVDGGSGNH